jgi:hypothetical protein
MAQGDLPLRLELIQALQAAWWPELPRRYSPEDGKKKGRSLIAGIVFPSSCPIENAIAGCPTCARIKAEFAHYRWG